MLINRRPDGTRIKVPGFTKLMPILMPTRTESTIYMEQEIELNDTMTFISEWNDNRPKDRRRLTVMQVLLTAMARAVVERPWINRFVSNFRHYQRNNISFSFVTKKSLSDTGKEVNVTMPFLPGDTLDSVNERFNQFVEQAKSDAGNKNDRDVDAFDKLPVFLLRIILATLKFMDRHNWMNAAMIKLMPFYCTAFLTNVGSLKIDAPLHHNFELGNTGLFVSLGQIKCQKALDDKGNVYERCWVKITYTFDERIVDGIYSGRTIKLIKHLTERPQLLVDKPEYSRKQLDELKLTEEGWKLWMQP